MKNRLSLLVALIFGLLPDTGRGQVIAGPITNTTTGHYYYLVGPTYWTNAAAQARKLGGGLVAINDAAENDWVLDTFGGYGGVSRILMIGFTDECAEGQWIWTSNEPASYTHWADGEPNNGQGIFPYENVAVMYGSDDPRAGYWNDMMGTLDEQQYWGVVEVSPRAVTTVRVSEVEISWLALDGVTYQPQYRSNVAGSVWLDLGTPMLGDGSVRVFKDSVPTGAAQRFYRTLIVQ